MRLLTLPLLLFIFAFAACTAVTEPEPSFADNNPVGSAALDIATAPAPRVTTLPTPTPFPNPTTLTLTPWPPDPVPSPTPVPPFPGMVFHTDEGTWRINANWQQQQVNADTNLVPGPNDTFLFSEAGDIWLWNGLTQVQLNISNTPEQTECCAEFWPGADNKLFFLRNPEMGSGIPVLYDLSSATETILSQSPDDRTMSDMAGSPDGRTLAYELNRNELWLYNTETQTAVQTNLAEFNIPEDVTIDRLGAPSWSADSQQLALILGIQSPQAGWQIALTVFDLANKTFSLYHPYENVGRGGWFPPAPWSPDQEWIAFVTEDIDSEKAGLWIINTHNKEEKFIPAAFNPLWSPDGQFLLYHTAVGPFLTYPPDFSYQLGLTLPAGATVIDWLERP